MDTPENYGVTDWVHDAYSSWDLKRNEVNASTNRGQYQLLESEIADIEDAQQYLANLNIIETAQESEDSQVKAAAAKALEDNIGLTDAYKKVVKDLKLFGDTNSQYQTLVDEQFKKMEQQQEALERAREYDAAAKEIEEKSNISDYYKSKEEDGIFEYSLDSFLYKMPGIMGSSSSSLKTQMLAGALSLAAGAIGAGLTPFTGGTSMAVALGVIGAINFGLGVYGATEENKAEVYDNMKSRVTQELQKSNQYDQVIKEARAKFDSERTLNDDELLDAALTGQVDINNVAFGKSVRGALKDVNQLYERDMVKLVGTEAVETAVEIIPFGKVLASTKTGAKTLQKLESASDKVKAVANKMRKKIDDATTFGIDQSVKGLAKRRVKNFIFDTAGRQLVLAANEMGEESV